MIDTELFSEPGPWAHGVSILSRIQILRRARPAACGPTGVQGDAEATVGATSLRNVSGDPVNEVKQEVFITSFVDLNHIKNRQDNPT